MPLFSPHAPVHPGVAVNRYYTSPTIVPATSASVVVADTAYWQPIILPRSFVNRIGISVSTGAAGLARVALYTNANNVPGTLIVDGGELDTTNIAVVEATISVTLPDAWVWMASVFNATPQCHVGTAANTWIRGGDTATGTGRGMTSTFTFGAFTASAPLTSFTASANVPIMTLRQV